MSCFVCFVLNKLLNIVWFVMCKSQTLDGVSSQYNREALMCILQNNYKIILIFSLTLQNFTGLQQKSNIRVLWKLNRCEEEKLYPSSLCEKNAPSAGWPGVPVEETPRTCESLLSSTSELVFLFKRTCSIVDRICNCFPSGVMAVKCKSIIEKNYYCSIIIFTQSNAKQYNTTIRDM